MAGDGIVTCCGEGLERNRAAIRITKRMMPLMMSQGRRDHRKRQGLSLVIVPPGM